MLTDVNDFREPAGKSGKDDTNSSLNTINYCLE